MLRPDIIFGLPRRLILGNLRVNTEVAMNMKYIVRLTDEARAVCEATINKQKGKSATPRRATILPTADADGPAWVDATPSEAICCRTRTV